MYRHSDHMGFWMLVIIVLLICGLLLKLTDDLLTLGHEALSLLVINANIM